MAIICTQILSFLEFRELWRLESVCRSWRRCVREEVACSHICLRAEDWIWMSQWGGFDDWLERSLKVAESLTISGLWDNDRVWALLIRILNRQQPHLRRLSLLYDRNRWARRKRLEWDLPSLECLVVDRPFFFRVGGDWDLKVKAPRLKLAALPGPMIYKIETELVGERVKEQVGPQTWPTRTFVVASGVEGQYFQYARYATQKATVAEDVTATKGQFMTFGSVKIPEDLAAGVKARVWPRDSW